MVQGNAWEGPLTLWHQHQLLQDPLSPVLDGRPVQKSRGSGSFGSHQFPRWTPRSYVISSNLATSNTRAVGLVLTLLHQAYLSPLGPLLGSAEGTRKRPLTLLYKVNAGGRFRPSGSWRGQRSGVGPCCMSPNKAILAEKSIRSSPLAAARALTILSCPEVLDAVASGVPAIWSSVMLVKPRKRAPLRLPRVARARAS